MTAFNTPQPCCVCGSAAVEVDEVFDSGRLILNECARCRHRWTQAFEGPIRSATLRVRPIAAVATDAAIATATTATASIATATIATAASAIREVAMAS